MRLGELLLRVALHPGAGESTVAIATTTPPYVGPFALRCSQKSVRDRPTLFAEKRQE
jgi:hypothetical protein